MKAQSCYVCLKQLRKCWDAYYVLKDDFMIIPYETGANHANRCGFLYALKYFILTNHGKKSNLYMG